MFSEDLDAVRMIYSQHVRDEVEHGKLVVTFEWGTSVTRKGATLLYLLHVCCESRAFSKSTTFLLEILDLGD